MSRIYVENTMPKTDSAPLMAAATSAHTRHTGVITLSSSAQENNPRIFSLQNNALAAMASTWTSMIDGTILHDITYMYILVFVIVLESLESLESKQELDSVARGNNIPLRQTSSHAGIPADMRASSPQRRPQSNKPYIRRGKVF